jgi:hypothetical protein
LSGSNYDGLRRHWADVFALLAAYAVFLFNFYAAVPFDADRIKYAYVYASVTYVVSPS